MQLNEQSVLGACALNLVGASITQICGFTRILVGFEGLILLPAVVTREGRVLRQRFNDEVETEPQTPTVMVERDRKNQRHNEKNDEHPVVIRAENQETKETDEQDRKLGRNHVCEDCANKKAVFALEQRHADRAMMPDTKGMCRNARFSAHRTQQPQTTTQD